MFFAGEAWQTTQGKGVVQENTRRANAAPLAKICGELTLYSLPRFPTCCSPHAGHIFAKMLFGCSTPTRRA